MSIWNKLKEKFKDLVIEIIGKREKIKPEPIVPQKPRPDIEPPKPVKPKEYDK